MPFLKAAIIDPYSRRKVYFEQYEYWEDAGIDLIAKLFLGDDAACIYRTDTNDLVYVCPFIKESTTPLAYSFICGWSEVPQFGKAIILSVEKKDGNEKLISCRLTKKEILAEITFYDTEQSLQLQQELLYPSKQDGRIVKRTAILINPMSQVVKKTTFDYQPQFVNAEEDAILKFLGPTAKFVCQLENGNELYHDPYCDGEEDIRAFELDGSARPTLGLGIIFSKNSNGLFINSNLNLSEVCTRLKFYSPRKSVKVKRDVLNKNSKYDKNNTA